MSIFALFLATMMIPFEATLIPNYITITRLPNPAPSASSSDFPFLTMAASWYNTYLALIIPWMANVVSVFLLRQFFISIPQELYDAAALDGCGHLRTLWSIMLPLARAPLAATIIFSFLGSWNSLLWPLLVTGKESLRPLQLGLSVLRERRNERPAAADGGVGVHHLADYRGLLHRPAAVYRGYRLLGVEGVNPTGRLQEEGEKVQD